MRSFNFFPGDNLDSELNFKKHLMNQPEDWYYRNKNITYTVNGQNYRTYDFNKVNWNESIVVIGCSLVYGVGVDTEDTITSRLEKIISKQVVNLGSPGASQQFCLYNLTSLLTYTKPKAVIMMWPQNSRTFHVINSYHQHGGFFNNWCLPEKYQYLDVFQGFETYKTNAVYNRLISNLICKDVPIIHSTFNEKDIDEFNELCPGHDTILLSINDLARDLMHPGVESNKLAANILANALSI